jgi:hypothetical protein
MQDKQQGDEHLKKLEVSLWKASLDRLIVS